MTELLICMIIVAILASFGINPHVADQTAKKEAEKIALFIHKVTTTAERTRQSFTIQINTTDRELTVNNDTFKVDANFAISYNNGNSITYNPSTGHVTNFGTLTVTRNDKSKHTSETDQTPYEYHVIISLLGRVRTSDQEPKKGEE